MILSVRNCKNSPYPAQWLVKSRFEDLNKRGVLFLVAYYNDIEGKN
ncbi:hypothetical protein ENHYD8BJ_80046 [Enhydrobacter sp. 8BJ]|nr:hypothetical protein ENHYD8BJ_80046 [Enhydrobacter sp. 8BJ]